MNIRLDGSQVIVGYHVYDWSISNILDSMTAME